MKQQHIFSSALIFAFVFGAFSLAPKETFAALEGVDARTDAPQQINDISFRLKGYVSTDGINLIYSYFEWGTTPELGSMVTLEKQTRRGPIHADVYFLEPETTYYYRTVVKTPVGEKYGNIESFTTGSETRPTHVWCTFSTIYNTLTGIIEKGCVDHGGYADAGGNDTSDPYWEIDTNLLNARTDTPNQINSLSWLFKGYAASDGFHDIYTYFEWGTTPELGSIAIIPNQTQDGPVRAKLNYLKSDTTYYYRTVVRTLVGVKYGEIESFTTGTIVPPPTCTLATVYNPLTGLLEYACQEHFPI